MSYITRVAMSSTPHRYDGPVIISSELEKSAVDFSPLNDRVMLLKQNTSHSPEHDPSSCTNIWQNKGNTEGLLCKPRRTYETYKKDRNYNSIRRLLGLLLGAKNRISN